LVLQVIKNGNHEGTAVVEFALILPVFLVLIFGVLEFGLIMHSKGIITLASREGARYGVVYRVPRQDAGQIQTKVQSYLQGVGVNGPLTITVTGAGGTTGSPLGVKVDYTYNYLVLPRFITGLTGNLTLSAETIMLLE
jgi:Flp pilus assembly protein TadG